MCIFIDWCIYKKFAELHNLALELMYVHVLKKQAIPEKGTLNFYIQLLLEYLEK